MPTYWTTLDPTTADELWKLVDIAHDRASIADVHNFESHAMAFERLLRLAGDYGCARPHDNPAEVTAAATPLHELVINGAAYSWSGNRVCYSDLVNLANERGTPTVTYQLRYRDGNTKDGSPIYNETIDLTDTVVALFDVIHTNRA